MKKWIVGVTSFFWLTGILPVFASTLSVEFSGTLTSSTYLPVGTAFSGTASIDLYTSPYSLYRYAAESFSIEVSGTQIIATDGFRNAINSGGQFRATQFQSGFDTINGKSISFLAVAFTFPNSDLSIPTAAELNGTTEQILLDLRADNSTLYANSYNTTASASESVSAVPLPQSLPLMASGLIILYGMYIGRNRRLCREV